MEEVEDLIGRSRFVSARDGLRLHARVYDGVHGAQASDALTVVCLPGLARTEADFERLAMALSGDAETPRRVVAIDSRGRGKSEYDRNADNYNLTVELDDALTVLTAFELAPAVIIGSSRGGLLAMLLAAARPTAIAGVLLNDIGPVIELKGLIRIKGYVGKLPQPRGFEEAAQILRRLFDSQFPTLTDADWLAAARRTWEFRDRRLTPTYDPRLSETLKGVAPERPLPALWREFDTLANVPVMVIRGANSDLLSRETVGLMHQRRPDLVSFEVPDQGHTPLLAEPDVIARIGDFIASCEAARRR